MKERFIAQKALDQTDISYLKVISEIYRFEGRLCFIPNTCYVNLKKKQYFTKKFQVKQAKGKMTGIISTSEKNKIFNA